MQAVAGGGDPLLAYDVPALAAAYDGFVASQTELHKRTRRGRVDASVALVLRTRLMDAWRSVIRLDPELPDELLPAKFPRLHARTMFIETYDALGPLAEQRLHQIVGEFRPDISVQLHYHRSGDLL